MAVQTRIQIRRGTLAQWVASAQTLGNGILYQGEIGYETDTGRFKIGDGSTAWSSLSYSNILPSNFIAGSGVTLTQGTNGSTLTIGLSNPTIQVSNITDFAEGVDDRVASLLTQGSGIGLTYNDSANTLQVAVTGIPSSLITNFASSVNDLIDSAVSTSIVAGSGVDIVYNSGTNTLTVSSALTAGSGIALNHSGGNYTISLSDPTVQLADVTDLSTDARNFLLTPSSNNLATLVTNETGSGNLVFSNSPQLTTSITTNSTSFNLFNTTATTVNAFGAATGVNIGAASGTTTVNNDLKVGANFSVNAAVGDVFAATFQTSEGDGTDSIVLAGNGTNAGLNRFLILQPATLSTSVRTISFPNANGTVALTNNKLSSFASTTSSELAVVISDETGTGSLVFSNSPTLVTPNIGVATGTSFNSITGLSSSTPLVDGTAAVGTSTAAARADHVHPTDTSRAAVAGTLAQFASTTSSQLAGVISDETGSGLLVFNNSPTLITPTLGVASATSLNKVNITAPATSATLTIADGKTLTASNSLTFTGTDSSSVAFGAGGTVVYTSNKLSALSSTTSAELAGVISDETGSGSLVFANNPTMSGVTINGNLTVGGSGLVASNINDFNTAVRTNRLDQMAAPTADVSLNSRKITNLADPTSDQDAATKAYVDAARAGLDVKQSVRVATTTNLLTLFGLLTIDGVTLVAGDRVLVKDQTGAQQPFNGIYVVSAGSWSRATDADSSAEVTAGMFTFVTEGTANADSGWVLTTNDTITLDTTALTFAQFSGAGQITAGAGMTKSGNTLDVGTASSSRIVVNADSIDLATVTQSNSSGSAGVNFAQSVSVDSYGRVTGVISADVRDATTSVKGISSFSSSSFDVTSGAVSIKTGGVSNSQLANSSVTVGSTSISLGGTSTTLAGLSSVTSTSFVGDLTGNASTATALQTSRTINGTSFNGSADITIAFVDGGTP